MAWLSTTRRVASSPAPTRDSGSLASTESALIDDQPCSLAYQRTGLQVTRLIAASRLSGARLFRTGDFVVSDPQRVAVCEKLAYEQVGLSESELHLSFTHIGVDALVDESI